MRVYSMNQVLLVLIVCVTSGSVAYASDQGATPRDSVSAFPLENLQARGARVAGD